MSSFDREKGEMEQDDDRNEGENPKIKSKPIVNKVATTLIDDTPMEGSIENHSSKEEQQKLITKHGSNKEIHLVKHLMKMKTNPRIKHLSKFVNRLERVVATINNLDGVKIMYKFSDELSEKVKTNTQELEFLSIEMKATLENLYRLKQKKTFIRKEKEFIKETYSNTKREQMQEMETVIAVYDKDLLRSWQIAKKSLSIPCVENFINQIKGKKQAVEYVSHLAAEKLLSLKNKLGKTPKALPKTVIKALPPPSSDSDSIISTD